MKKVRVGIVGVSGYTGLELVKMLLQHPYFELTYVSNSDGAPSICQIHPSLLGVLDMQVKKLDSKEAASECDLVFLALPHKTAMQTAKELLFYGARVVDLSADYRLSLEAYEKNYCEHEDVENLAQAVYSIPELHCNKAKDAKLIANPGCHVTASLLAMAPFLDIIDCGSPVFIDSKTGVSGAGKSPSSAVHFVSVNDNLNPYNIIKHRHAAEITEHANRLANIDVKLTFVPSLIPMTRGMLATVYATLKDNSNISDKLKSFYTGKKFVRVRDELPHTKFVSGTHFADVYAVSNGNALVSFCAIDNLLRGASSQAIANANIMFGFDEGAGIPVLAYNP